MSTGRPAEGGGTKPGFDLREQLQIDPDAVTQWLDWETQANLVGFRTSTAPVEVSVAWVPREEVEIHILPGAAPEIVDRFLQGDVRVKADRGNKRRFRVR